MRIAKQQQVVRSPSLITSIDLQTTGGLFSKTFRANVPFFSFFILIHPSQCCAEIWAVKIFQKFCPNSLDAHEYGQTTTSGVLSSQEHKHLQTTGRLFLMTFRSNVPFGSFFFHFSQHRVVQKFELLKYSKSFLRFPWRPKTFAKPLPVVCSPPAITSNIRPRVVYFQRRFGPMCPSSVFFFLFLLHPTPSCSEIWGVKIFEKYFPDSLEVHDNCQTTTSGVFFSQNHKQLQTTGGLFSKTFRANVSFVIFSFFFTSPNTMLYGNLSYSNVRNVLSGFSGGPWQLPNHYNWCALLPKSQATSDHKWFIFKDVSGQCALRHFFFLLHPALSCPEIWAVKIL